MFADRCRWANRVLIEWQQQFPVFIWMILLSGSQWWHVQKKQITKNNLGFLIQIEKKINWQIVIY